MRVIETLEQVADRLQIAMVVGSVPTDSSGDIRVLFANASAASLFAYPGPGSMKGLDVRDLMPPDVSKDHRHYVSDYVKRANGGAKRASGIMDAWRNLNARRRDGSLVAVQANVADIRNSEERYFVAVFRDRTADAEKEAALIAALDKTKSAFDAADKARKEAERHQKEAEEARKAAEDNALKQKRLSGQITLLRQVFAGTMLLVVMLGVMVVAQWSTGGQHEGLSMIKDVLLVLTGILGSAMASVFDSKNRDT